MPYRTIWVPVNVTVAVAPAVEVHLKWPSWALVQLPEQSFHPAENAI